MDNYENAKRSLSSIKKADDYGMFQMTYYGDYGFDEFLKVGAKDQEELEAVIERLVFKDIADIEANINILGGGCTVFTTRNAAGEVIFGRNYDFAIYSPPLQLTTRPGNGYASISTASMLYLGYGENNLPSGLNAESLATLAAPYIPADGVNEKGVAIAFLSVSEAKPPFCEDKITINTTAAVRLVLDKAASVDEAIELMKQYNVFFSLDIYCHFLIADASGRSVLVEYWDNDLKVVETQIASNFIAYNDLRIAQGNAIERYDKVKNAFDSNNGILNQAQTIDLLVDIGWKSPEFGNGLQWSVIYNLSTLKGTIFANSNTDNLVDFSLTKQ
ncbi:MAG: linear amide C-N hydrolase [Defluviitaleaceae bacterium]|nr:linear amide C-N hydrolase [Defluviitaleaceae bacterium]